MIDEPCFLCPRGEMDIIQVSGTWGLGSIPGEGMSLISLGFSERSTLQFSRIALLIPIAQISGSISFLFLPGSDSTNLANLLLRSQVVNFLRREMFRSLLSHPAQKDSS